MGPNNEKQPEKARTPDFLKTRNTGQQKPRKTTNQKHWTQKVRIKNTHTEKEETTSFDKKSCFSYFVCPSPEVPFGTKY